MDKLAIEFNKWFVSQVRAARGRQFGSVAQQAAGEEPPEPTAPAIPPGNAGAGLAGALPPARDISDMNRAIVRAARGK